MIDQLTNFLSQLNDSEILTIFFFILTTMWRNYPTSDLNNTLLIYQQQNNTKIKQHKTKQTKTP